MRALDPGHYTTPGQGPVTKPWAISCVEMNYHRETEISETSSVLFKRKSSTVHEHRPTGGQRAVPSLES